MPLSLAAEGKTTPLMRQLGLIACCESDEVLAEIGRTGYVEHYSHCVFIMIMYHHTS